LPAVDRVGQGAQSGAGTVYRVMGYILGFIIVLIVIPLLVLMLTRRTSGGGGIESSGQGVSPNRPSAEEPTPRPGPGVDPHIPPA
jgi:hypothetical protein